MRNPLTYGNLLVVLALSVIVSGLLSGYTTEYANGWDGYYYLVQIQSFTETGEMHSPEYSPVYIPLLAFYYLTGDCITAARISSVLIKLMFVLSVFFLSLTLLRSSLGEKRENTCFAALLIAALSSASPSLNYFFLQFPKNLMGFSFFFFFWACVLNIRDRMKQGKRGLYHWWAAGALLLFLAAFFTHRFSAVLSILFLVLFSAYHSRRLIVRITSGGKALWIAVSAAVLLAAVPVFSNKLPLAPSIRDLERITGDLSSVPVFVPNAFTETFGIRRLNTEWMIEIYAAAVLPMVFILLLPWRKKFSFLALGRDYSILCILSLIGLFPFLKFSLTGLSYRLFFGTLLMLPLICIPYAWFAAKKTAAHFRKNGKRIPRSIPLSVYFSVLALSFFTRRSYRPELHDPPYALYERVAENAIIALGEEEFDLIIAHRSLAEFITFRHRVDALPWAPEEYYQRDRVWRITAGILRDEVSYYLSPETADDYFVRLAGDYGLLREDHWETFVEKISCEPVMMESVHIWRNPMDIRPSFLTGNKRL